MSMRWSNRRSLGVLVAAMTVTVLLYCSIGPYPVAITRGSMMTGVEKKLFAKHAINNTVVVVPVNTGMINLADNLLCSLSATTFDVNKIIFWALDDGAERILDKRGFATFREPSLYGVSQDTNHNGGTEEYRRMMQERPKFYMDLLATGYDVLMIDADTVFWQSPEVIIPDRDSVDIVYSTDSREFYQSWHAYRDFWRRGTLMPPICNGLFWMKGTPKTVQMWRDMQHIFEAGWRNLFFRLLVFQDDQRGVDYLLNDGRAQLVRPYPRGIKESMVPHVKVKDETLVVQLLDQTKAVSGHLLRNRHSVYDRNLQQLRKDGDDRISAHFNWDSTKQSKKDGAKALGMYFLDDSGKCNI